MRPTYPHNHKGGIVADGSCRACVQMAEVLADDMGDMTLDMYLGIDFHVNTEENYQIMLEGEPEDD